MEKISSRPIEYVCVISALIFFFVCDSCLLAAI